MKPKPPAPSTVDELGTIKAQIAVLIEEESRLKHILTDYYQDTGIKEFHGELFDATVSEYDKEVLDMAAVKEKLSPQFIRAHTSLTHVVRVGVTAKKRN